MTLINATIEMFMDTFILNLLNDEIGREVVLDTFKFSKDYYEYLLRSMSSLKFDSGSIEDFTMSWESYREWLEQLFQSTDVKKAVWAKDKIRQQSESLVFWENEIKRRFVRDWNENLSVLKEGECENYAILVQALQEIDFCNPGRGQAIACSLFTDKFQKLYHDRNLGFVYQLENRDLIMVSTSDANSSFSREIDFKQNCYSNKVIGDAFGSAYLQGQAFFSYKEFTDRCNSDEFNEILFNRSSWEAQLPVGVFVRDGISERGRRFAEYAAEMRGIPICRVHNGVLQISH